MTVAEKTLKTGSNKNQKQVAKAKVLLMGGGGKTGLYLIDCFYL